MLIYQRVYEICMRMFWDFEDRYSGDSAKSNGLRSAIYVYIVSETDGMVIMGS